MQPTAAQRKRTLHLIWLAMSGAVVLYGLVANLIPRPERSIEQASWSTTLLLAVAGSCYLAAWLVLRFVMNQARQQLSSAKTGGRIDEKIRLAPERLSAGVIVSLAFLESAVVLGLVGSLLGCCQPYVFQAVALVSLLSMGMLRTRGMPQVFSLLDEIDSHLNFRPER